MDPESSDAAEIDAAALVSRASILDGLPIETRVDLIHRLPLLCKNEPGYVYETVDLLGRCLISDKNVERDAAQKSLMSLLRQDVKTSLSMLFKHVDSGVESIREKVICYLKDKVFPLKSELLQPQAEMEKHVTHLVKSLKDVTGADFKIFIDFLKCFSIFGEGSPPEHVQKLVEIIEAHADLDAEINLSDDDHMDRFIDCMLMALPFFMRGTSSAKFLNYFKKKIIPVFAQFPEDRKLSLLQNFAEISPYATTQDSQELLPLVFELLKNYLPQSAKEDSYISYVECLLFAFHHLAYKSPDTTNSLCGYHFLNGEPADSFGYRSSVVYTEFMNRLDSNDTVVRDAFYEVDEAREDYRMQLSMARTENDKAEIQVGVEKATSSLTMFNNVLMMTQPLYSYSPDFMGESYIRLSWMGEEQAVEPSPASNAAAGS